MCALAVLASLVAGCSLLVGDDEAAGDDASADDGGTGPDADPTAPRVFVPALFPEAEAALSLPAGGYLLEGSGFRFASLSAQTPGDHRPIPLVIDRLTAQDVVQIEIPPELGGTWIVCGSNAAAGSSLDVAFNAPCARDEAVAALTLVVPVDPATGQGVTVTPLGIRVTRDDRVFDLQVPVVALDEVAGSTPRVTGVFSTILVDEAFVPDLAGPGVEWAAVSAVEIGHQVVARGRNGLGGFGCSAGGCSGGESGPGSDGDGQSSMCFNAQCSAPGPRGGRGGTSSCVGNCFNGVSAGGGGGGHDGDGDDGRDSTCGTPGAGGDAAPPDPMLLAFEDAWGGGGAAGAHADDGAGATRYGGGGGGGGGRVDVVTLGTLMFTGSGEIDASGGSGGDQGPAECNAQRRAGPGGGAAGGGIRARAEQIVSSADLDAVILVARGQGGLGSLGRGSRGRIRIDGLGADSLDTSVAGVVRGPELDPLAPVSRTSPVSIGLRAHSAASPTSYGHRAAADSGYNVLNTTTTGGGVVSVSIELAVGLNEICVFAEPPQVVPVADNQPDGRRCQWVAYAPE